MWNMTTKERMKLLTKWKEQFEVCDKAWTELGRLFNGLDVDSVIGMVVWGNFEKYTELVSMAVGDSGSWLSWYCLENDMGAKGHSAKASKWKSMRVIRSLNDLCKIIEADI